MQVENSRRIVGKNRKKRNGKDIMRLKTKKLQGGKENKRRGFASK